MNVCNYNCGKEAHFKLKNGKFCCSSSPNKCEAVRLKNSTGLKSAYKCGKKQNVFNYEHRQKSIVIKRQNALEQFLKVGSSYSNHAIKNILINKLSWKDECSFCGIVNWNDKKLSMQLDHINGNNSDNRIENLRLLCPNCHSQTDTFCGKSINTGRTKVSDVRLLEALLKHSKNVRKALIEVQLSPRGANYARAYKLLSTLKET